MSTRFIPRFAILFALAALVGLSLSCHAQDDEKHGRKYKAPPETAHIVVTVVKSFNGKPIANASVIFHPIDSSGKDQGSMQIKSDPDGHASLDLIPVGSTLRLQVHAEGFAPYGASYDISTNAKEIRVKMETPRAQVSAFADNPGNAADPKPGINQRTAPAATNSSQPAPAQTSKP